MAYTFGNKKMALADLFMSSGTPSAWRPCEFDWLPPGHISFTSDYINSYSSAQHLISDYAKLHAIRAYHAGGTILLAESRIAYFEPRSSSDLALWFNVGAHGDEDPVKIASLLAHTDSIYPIAPYFASSAGFRARFVNSIDLDNAKIIAERFESVSEAWNIAECYDLNLADYIFAAQEIPLWWD
jgi:hypothetical protein